MRRWLIVGIFFLAFASHAHAVPTYIQSCTGTVIVGPGNATCTLNGIASGSRLFVITYSCGPIEFGPADISDTFGLNYYGAGGGAVNNGSGACNLRQRSVNIWSTIGYAPSGNDTVSVHIDGAVNLGTAIIFAEYSLTGAQDPDIFTSAIGVGLLNDSLDTANCSVTNGGVGYALNDTGTVNGGSPLGKYIVTGVAAGAVTAFDITYGGGGYSVAVNVATTATSGAGTGFLIDINGLAQISSAELSTVFTADLLISGGATSPNGTGNSPTLSVGAGYTIRNSVGITIGEAGVTTLYLQDKISGVGGLYFSSFTPSESPTAWEIVLTAFGAQSALTRKGKAQEY